MNFSLSKTLEILENTPEVISHLVKGLSEEWTHKNEGPETWSVYDVIGHLIHTDNTNWMVRINIILSDDTDKNFPPFDRFAQFENSKGKTLQQLLEEFKSIRLEKLKEFKNINFTKDDLNKTGIHSAFGEVTLAQLIATWAVHDLNHISQITRVLAFQYKNNAGPWNEYLRILK